MRSAILLTFSLLLLTLLIILLIRTPSQPRETLVYTFTLPPSSPGEGNVVFHTVWANGTPASSIILVGGASCVSHDFCRLALPRGVYTAIAITPFGRTVMQNFTLRDHAEITLTIPPAKPFACTGRYTLEHAAVGTRSEAWHAWIACNGTRFALANASSAGAFILPAVNGSMLRVEGWIAQARHGWWGWQDAVYVARAWRVES